MSTTERLKRRTNFLKALGITFWVVILFFFIAGILNSWLFGAATFFMLVLVVI